jgi:3-isopropylmalate/(R)-2-methylmalate dehydratase small subunit
VWALQDHGFRVVVSSRFADIFRSNALKGGLLPVELPRAVVEQLMSLVESDPSTPLTVDLTAREVAAGVIRASFDIDAFTRWRLLEGLDDIDLTLRHAENILEFEKARPSWLPVVR